MKPFIQNSSNKGMSFFLGVSTLAQKTFYLDQDFNKLDKLLIKSKNTCNKNTLKKTNVKNTFFYNTKTCKIIFFVCFILNIVFNKKIKLMHKRFCF